MQGAATSVYAITAPELHGQSGAFLANCDVAKTKHASAEDPQLASRLWDITEQQIKDALARC